jgi:3-isopropylmalate/(R)-2-methylmalate dehydratase small subunit
VDVVMEQAAMGAEITINLEEQHIEMQNASTINFEVEEFRKHCLLNGLDDIGLTMQKTAAIDVFEAKNREQCPWLYAG